MYARQLVAGVDLGAAGAKQAEREEIHPGEAAKAAKGGASGRPDCSRGILKTCVRQTRQTSGSSVSTSVG
jgi:hypothetical protein